MMGILFGLICMIVSICFACFFWWKDAYDKATFSLAMAIFFKPGGA
jgi:uncharacterized protein YxeA